MYELFKDFGAAFATLVQSIVIAFGAYFAWKTIKCNSDIAKKRSTLDLITDVLQSDEFKQQLLVVNAMRKAREEPSSLYTQLRSPGVTDDQRNELRSKLMAAQFVLNKFSIMAIGIRNDALDEQSFKEYYYSTFVEIAGFLNAFMLSMRTIASNEIKSQNYVSNETVYEEIIWLLDRWRANPLRKLAAR